MAHIKNHRRVIEGLVRGLQYATREVLSVSQPNTPYKTGELRSSGKTSDLPNGGVAEYTAAHAARQEFGIDPGTTEPVSKHNVKKHDRRVLGKRGPKKVDVRAHDRGPYTRTYDRGMKGHLYLTHAWERVRAILPDFLARGVEEMK